MIQRRILLSLLFWPLIAFATTQESANSALEYLKGCNLILSPEEIVTLDDEKQSQFVQDMIAFLNRQVIGQPDAVNTVANHFGLSMANLDDPLKPRGSFLFMGPTGVGKTELVKAVIEFLGGNPDVDLIRVDSAEFQHGSSISRLIGTTQGYAGFGQIPDFHPSNLKRTAIKITLSDGRELIINIALVDEIEKAGDELSRLLLGILDEGKVTMGDRSVTLFRNAFLFGTSNLGAETANKLIEIKIQNLRAKEGDLLSREEIDLTGRHDTDLGQQIDAAFKSGLEEKYPPEFINRWSATAIFRHLGQEQFDLVLQKMLAKLQKRIFARGIVKVNLVLANDAKRLVVDSGTDFRNGARELQRTLDRLSTVRLANLMNTGEVKEGDVVMGEISKSNRNKLKWTVVGRGLSRQQMSELANVEYPNYGLLNAPYETKDESLDSLSSQSSNIFDQLRENPLAIKELYLQSKAPHIAGHIIEGGTSVEVSVILVKIAGQIAEIQNRKVTGFRIEPLPEVPDKYKKKYSGVELEDWSIEQVQQFIKAAANGAG